MKENRALHNTTVLSDRKEWVYKVPIWYLYI